MQLTDEDPSIGALSPPDGDEGVVPSPPKTEPDGHGAVPEEMETRPSSRRTEGDDFVLQTTWEPPQHHPGGLRLDASPLLTRMSAAE